MKKGSPLSKRTLEVILGRAKSATNMAWNLVEPVVIPVWNGYSRALQPVYDGAKFLVDGSIHYYKAAGQKISSSRRSRIKGRIIPSSQLPPLIHVLAKYANEEAATVAHKIELNESVKGDDDMYDSELSTRPENNVAAWKRLSEQISNLSQYSGDLTFDTVQKRFLVDPNHLDSNLEGLVTGVNLQLSLGNDFSVISDGKYVGAALSGRADFGGKLAKRVVSKHKSRISKYISEGGIVFAGPESIELVNPGQSQPRLFTDYINPTFKKLVIRNREGLEEVKEVAKAGNIAYGTTTGNIEGVLNVGKYAVIPYTILRYGLVQLDNNFANDGGVLDTVFNLSGSLLDFSTFMLSFILPSYGEIRGIGRNASYEKISRLIESYRNGKKGVDVGGQIAKDMTLYNQVLSTFSNEDTFEVEQMNGWKNASLWTAIAVATGLIAIPAIQTGTMSAQVSTNNYWANGVNFANFLKPLMRERRRKLVAERPELVSYWGIDKIVDPTVEDKASDLRNLNPRNLEYLVSGNGPNGNDVSVNVPEGRRAIEAEVDRIVQEKLEAYTGLDEDGKADRLVRDYLMFRLKKSGSLIADILNRVKNKNQSGDSLNKEKIKGPGMDYRIRVAVSDVPKALASYLKRPFNMGNWAVPITFMGGFYLLSTTDFSPSEAMRNVPVESFYDILNKDLLYMIGASAIGLGALDTAGAGIWARAHKATQQRIHSAKYMLFGHANVVEHGIEESKDAAVYKIPLNGSNEHYNKVMDLLSPLQPEAKFKTLYNNTLDSIEPNKLGRFVKRVLKSKDGPVNLVKFMFKPVRDYGNVRSHVLTDTNESFNAQYTIKDSLTKKTRISAVRNPTEQFITLYASRDLGSSLEAYKVK